MTSQREPRPGECWHLKRCEPRHGHGVVVEVKSYREERHVVYEWDGMALFQRVAELEEFHRIFEPCAEHTPKETP